MLISIMSMPLLLRSIGVDQFGLVNLALSVIIFTNIIVGFGFNISAPREVAIFQDQTKKLSSIASQILFTRLALAAVTALSLWIAAYAFNFFKDYKEILMFSTVLLFSEAILPLWFFQGMEKMKYITYLNILASYFSCLG